jgi:hypothetical protein
LLNRSPPFWTTGILFAGFAGQQESYLWAIGILLAGQREFNLLDNRNPILVGQQECYLMDNRKPTPNLAGKLESYFLNNRNPLLVETM